MRGLAGQPSLTQPVLPDAVGISLGKLNSEMRALIERGWVKSTNNLRRSVCASRPSPLW
jgi:hypothetical protein